MESDTAFAVMTVAELVSRDMALRPWCSRCTHRAVIPAYDLLNWRPKLARVTVDELRPRLRCRKGFAPGVGGCGHLGVDRISPVTYRKDFARAPVPYGIDPAQWRAGDVAHRCALIDAAIVAAGKRVPLSLVSPATFWTFDGVETVIFRA